MIIGLTGSIASGKSTVSNMLKEKGFPIVDADEIARRVVEPGSELLKEIENIFGNKVLFADGSLNRVVLGELIFGDEQARLQLNAIMHPAIRKEMIRQKQEHLSNGAQTVIMDIPLLIESKLQSYVEKIIVVSVTPKVQIERLKSRNVLSDEEALVRIQSQLPMHTKEQYAHAVIDNNASLKQTEQQLDEILLSWNVEL